MCVPHISAAVYFIEALKRKSGVHLEVLQNLKLILRFPITLEKKCQTAFCENIFSTYSKQKHQYV